jgi:hypothetical protein
VALQLKGLNSNYFLFCFRALKQTVACTSSAQEYKWFNVFCKASTVLLALKNKVVISYCVLKLFGKVN